MKDINNYDDINEEMIAEMDSTYMEDPVNIELADFNLPFIYDRDWGVFYIQPGLHQMCMCMLYAWRYGHNSIQAMMKNDLDFKTRVRANSYSSNTKYSFIADLYLLELEGTAISSSSSHIIQIGKLKNLNQKEKSFFSNYQTDILGDILNIK